MDRENPYQSWGSNYDLPNDPIPAIKVNWDKMKEMQLSEFINKSEQLEAQLAEARAVQARYREALGRLPKDLRQYADRDDPFAFWVGASETLQDRIESLLSRDSGRYAKAVRGVIEAAAKFKGWECCEECSCNTCSLVSALVELRAAEKGS